MVFYHIKPHQRGLGLGIKLVSKKRGAAIFVLMFEDL